MSASLQQKHVMEHYIHWHDDQARLSANRLPCRVMLYALSYIGGTVTAGCEVVLGCAGACC